MLWVVEYERVKETRRMRQKFHRILDADQGTGGPMRFDRRSIRIVIGEGPCTGQRDGIGPEDGGMRQKFRRIPKNEAGKRWFRQIRQMFCRIVVKEWWIRAEAPGPRDDPTSKAGGSLAEATKEKQKGK
jgi:hypothetical protein